MSRPLLADVDLNLLVALNVILREGSVTRAAARLGVTQSAMSHTLNRLRAHYEDPLLVRRGSEMVRTALAEHLSTELAGALDGVERVLATRSSFDPLRAVRSFALFASDYAQAVVIPPLLARVRDAAPGVDLVVRATREPERALAGSDSVLMIGPTRDVAGALLRQVLFVDRLVCVTRRGHPAIAGGLTLERYLDAKHVLVAPRDLPGGIVDDELGRRGHERRVVLKVPHFLVGPLVIVSSDLLLTIPERLAMRLCETVGLVASALPFETPPIEFVQLWHPRHQSDAAHGWLRAQVAAAACG